MARPYPKTVAIFAAVACSLLSAATICTSFTVSSISTTTRKRTIRYGAAQIVTSGDDPASIKAAASFMVDSFWLKSPQNLIQGGEGSQEVSDTARSALIQQQEEDLTDKYGERMGKRLLESCLLIASNENGDMAGLVGIEARLLDVSTEEILTAEASESKLKGAIASLGPKQRRQYKDSPAAELVAELLPPDLKLACVLSNLCVSPSTRRSGLGSKLCQAAEEVAKGDWGFDDMYLRVEADNTAARALYEERLGYERKFCDDEAKGLRVDLEAGDFTEIGAKTFTLVKSLS
eukprot:CAMPEP_0183294606 /NCGR_PEP_ID=MMETSP0160_2-20130417/2879_1 /TAXON_ID=2839 ORGANISM="Odontella Sinensis, Strain Grunow 1884" /NCGR_SAMPLE_ID=MMETSP0160_2 /ASSEMBLY_ACC=CAM_ASM_000250 /LENGTH=290 /DNA_ID=CAMNT_0025455957 /DNA_START=35 /DNA_END=907 /DNA_ORIENTATION=+